MSAVYQVQLVPCVCSHCGEATMPPALLASSVEMAYKYLCHIVEEEPLECPDDDVLEEVDDKNTIYINDINEPPTLARFIELMDKGFGSVRFAVGRPQFTGDGSNWGYYIYVNKVVVDA